MIEVFKNGKSALYAVIGKFKSKEAILREVANLKKESLASVKSKFGTKPGYIVERKGMLELYEADGEIPKGAQSCVIVRRK